MSILKEITWLLYKIKKSKNIVNSRFTIIVIYKTLTSVPPGEVGRGVRKNNTIKNGKMRVKFAKKGVGSAALKLLAYFYSSYSYNSAI